MTGGGYTGYTLEINYSKENQPVEIEILNASRFLEDFLPG